MGRFLVLLDCMMEGEHEEGGYGSASKSQSQMTKMAGREKKSKDDRRMKRYNTSQRLLMHGTLNRVPCG